MLAAAGRLSTSTLPYTPAAGQHGSADGPRPTGMSDSRGQHHGGDAVAVASAGIGEGEESSLLEAMLDSFGRLAETAPLHPTAARGALSLHEAPTELPSVSPRPVKATSCEDLHGEL